MEHQRRSKSTAKQIVLLSPEDEDLRRYCHWSSSTGYIGYTKLGQKGSLHKAVVGRMGIAVLPGFEIDHINRLKFDNRRENLRVISMEQNHTNRSGKGYHFYKRDGNWVAQVTRNRKKIHLGYFATEKEAKIARDEFLVEEARISMYVNLTTGEKK